MAFDQPTRNRLARFVKDARDLITDEFTQKFAERFGIADDGTCAPLEKLTHLDEPGLATAALLRQRIDYLVNSHPEERAGRAAAVKRLAREQAFTVLNRLAALRMAEKRQLILESVGKGYQSKGYKLYATVAGTGLGETYERYRRYLFCLCDELAVDLGALFDRHLPHGILFPREPALLGLLDLLNAADLEHLWAEDETIGWIYQYYNDEAERKKMREESSVPRNSRELAVRNQFFTPRYVVEFLTDNTLGRLWYEMTRGETALRDRCRYLVRRPTEIFLKPGETAPKNTADGEASATENHSQEELLRQPVHIPHRPLKDPREIRLLDPACGSMHFGLYAFDLFTVIYDEAWEIAHGPDDAAKSAETFAPFVPFAATFPDKAAFLREVPRLIIEHNIHGIDIDPRAAQIAGLSLWLRAQRAWHQAGVKPADRPRITRSNLVCAEPMPGEKELLGEFVEQQFPAGERPAFAFLLETVFDRMTLAGEAGSLLRIEEEIRAAIAEAKQLWKAGPKHEQATLFPETGARPGQGEMRRDLSGITDEQFWERAEQRIYDALETYAEQAENGGGFQRRLFADDAARGFAFIDLCRKRYDVAVMNPPFGTGTPRSEEQLKRGYPNTNKNLYCGFQARTQEMLCDGGCVGAITDATFLCQSSFADYRRTYLLEGKRRLLVLADLGWGVLDAWVHTALQIVFHGAAPAPMLCIRADQNSDKAQDILGALHAAAAGELTKDGFCLRHETFEALPDSSLLFWLSNDLIEAFENCPSLDPSLAACRTGLNTGDNDRFYKLWWEVNNHHIGRERIWVRLSNGGSYQPYHRAFEEVIFWQDDGAVIKNYKDANGRQISRPQNTQFFFRAGLTYGKRTECLNVQLLNEGMVFTDEGHSILPAKVEDSWMLMSFLNSVFIRDLMNTVAGLHKTGGYVGKLPLAKLPSQKTEPLESLAKQTYEVVRLWHEQLETAPRFTVPTWCVNRTTWSAMANKLQEDEVRVRANEDAVDELMFEIYGIPPEERVATRQRVKKPANAIFSDVSPDEAQDDAAFFAEQAVQYLLGCVFGRWDIRYATGERPAPELQDPFAPLPVCPPGMLQGDDGLPLSPEAGRRLRTEGRYPLDVAWDGILVDDPEHPHDLERRVHAALAVLWGGGGAPSTRADALEHEACTLLGVPTLREWFRRPAGFFADHLKRYSKSRRQAPIYWPLSTKSGTYTLWIYYHRLSDQTLHTAIADFVEPKIKAVEATLASARAANRIGELADAQEFLDELREFKAELERLTKLPWRPNLNDGVLITASPLWKLFRLSKWQKDLKACWEELERGDYDWAHLARTLRPKEVEEKCKTDRSLAIAHGLEHLCQIEPPKPKAKRGKKAKVEEPELSEET